MKPTLMWPLGTLAIFALLLAAGAEAQDTEEAPGTGSVFGRILDQDTFQPLAGVMVRISTADGILQEISGARGTFLITGVPVGERVVVLEHIAYGEYAQHVNVESGKDLQVDAWMSPRAIQFEPVVVEVLSELERRRLTSGFNVNEIPAEEIELAARTGQHLGDLLRGGMPGVRVRGGSRPGQYLCVEYRGSGAGECDEIAVYLDGVVVAEPGMLYSRAFRLDEIDRVEILSPLEAVIRYGDRAARGALLIESRSTALRDDADFPGARLGSFDWSLDGQPHPWTRVLGTSVLSNAVGAGLGYLLLTRCVKAQRMDTGVHFDTDCGAFTTMSTGVLALSLPGIAGAATSSRAGATERSRGRFSSALMAGLVSTTAGFVMLMHSEDPEYQNDNLRMAGLVTITVGTPLLLTLSDRVFRSLR